MLAAAVVLRSFRPHTFAASSQYACWHSLTNAATFTARISTNKKVCELNNCTGNQQKKAEVRRPTTKKKTITRTTHRPREHRHDHKLRKCDPDDSVRQNVDERVGEVCEHARHASGVIRRAIACQQVILTCPRRLHLLLHFIIVECGHK